MSDVNIKQATIYNAIAKYGSMIVQLGLTMVLSRLILPEAFGVIAIMTVVLGFLSLFADMGLAVNIIQHPEMPNSDVNTLFSFSCLIGVFLAFATFLLGLPLSFFYEDDIYCKLCAIASVISLFSATNMVPNAILIRDKKFRTIAVRTILCSVVSGLIAVILALLDWGVYALILQTVISSVFVFFWNYIQHPLKIVVFHFKHVVSLLGKYSLFQIYSNFLNYFTRNLDHLIIGKSFGSEELAYYNKSYSLYLYPNAIFTSVITGVLHPFIREYKNDVEKMMEKYIQIVKYLSIIGVFIMTVTFYCSNEIIIIMFGENWEPGGILLKCLSICMWAQMMSSVCGSIFLGLERTDKGFWVGVMNFIFLLVAIIVGVMFQDLVVLALGVGITYNLSFLYSNYVLIVKTMKQSFSRFIKNFYVDGTFAFIFLMITLSLPSFTYNVYITFILKFIICIGAFLLFIIISGQWRLFKEIMAIAHKK